MAVSETGLQARVRVAVTRTGHPTEFRDGPGGPPPSRERAAGVPR
ncbi:hypothetical protein GCM10023108_27620 [Saccharopolyspora hordei]|uniref:Uncharacterized protein n=1 Tax=Saccharopolyspora hordei TaxID=1838 RepID=A0A853ANT0_9PSEU|nr:hypothetical protein [Saccharopolyspora hordei]